MFTDAQLYAAHSAFLTVRGMGGQARFPDGRPWRLSADTGAVHGPRRPTVAEVADLYPLYARNGWFLMPLLRQARDLPDA